MNLPDFLVLALVEGVADALPIDATAHSLLASKILGWRAGTIGVSIHLGAALALFAFLWREVGLIGQGLWKLRKARIEPGMRLLTKVLVTAAPWVVIVTVNGHPAPPQLSDLLVVGLVTILCAVVLGVSDRLCMTVKRVEHVGGLSAIVVGLAQLLAVFPGVGRSAAVLTATRMLGVERPAAYRYMLLVNIPALLAESGHDAVQFFLQGVRPSATDALAAGITFALVLLAVSVGMSWANRISLMPFALYRLAVGAGLVALSFL